MLVKEIDLKIFSKTSYYSASGRYLVQYGLTDENVETQSSQKFLIKVPSAGFIAKNGKVLNFYIHNGSGFDTFPETSFSDVTYEDYQKFKMALANKHNKTLNK